MINRNQNISISLNIKFPLLHQNCSVHLHCRETYSFLFELAKNSVEKIETRYPFVFRKASCNGVTKKTLFPAVRKTNTDNREF